MESTNQEKGWTFNTVSETYDKMRPGYPDELYQGLFAYAPLNASCASVEIGIGAGQASLPVLKTGCALTAVEYGDQLAEVCREKFHDYSRFSVITGKFEDAVLPEDAFDLVYSASAFHWVPEEIGYREELLPGLPIIPIRQRIIRNCSRKYSVPMPNTIIPITESSRGRLLSIRKSRQPQGQRSPINTGLQTRGMPCFTGSGS